MGRERYNQRAIRGVVERLKELRHERGLSQTDVYIDTDVNIGRIEAEFRNVTISTIANLCAYYQISLEEFFKGIDTK